MLVFYFLDPVFGNSLAGFHVNIEGQQGDGVQPGFGLQIFMKFFLSLHEGKNMLTENEREKGSLPSCSVCIINMWFDKNENLKNYKIERPCFDDVVLYYHEDNIFKRGNLSRVICND